MDTIWYRNPSKSEVIGRCGGNEKTTNDHAEPTKVQLQLSLQRVSDTKHITNYNSNNGVCVLFPIVTLCFRYC